MHADQLHILASKLFFYIARIIRSILVAMHADQLSLDTNHCKCNYPVRAKRAQGVE